MLTSTTYQRNRLEKILHSLDEPYALFLSAIHEITQKNKEVAPLKKISEHPSIKGKGYTGADIFGYLRYLINENILTHSSPIINGRTVDAYKIPDEALPLVKKLLEEGKTTGPDQVA
jgi:hypothetical protein